MRALAIAVLLVGCGGANDGADPNTPTTKQHAPDHTEVTMERVPIDGDSGAPISNAAAAASPSAANANPTPVAATSAVDPSDDEHIGGKQEPRVEKAIAPVRPRIRACYKKALAAEPGLGGTATFDATIGKDGKVASARFVKRDGLNDDMVGCLLAAIKGISFEGVDKSQIVALSFGKPTRDANDAGAPKP